MSLVFDVKERLAQMGLQPKKAFGQNFLVNSGVIGRIIEQVTRTPHTDLIEIGPGLGALTEPLMAQNHRPRLIELDRDLVAYWRDQRGMDVVDHDALKLDWSELQLRPNSLLVSNLPYQISSSLVIERCLGPASVQHMVLMFQKEVAQRLMATPKSKDYGLLSVMAQLHFKMRKVADAAPGDFFPPPKVASRVLYFERLADPMLGVDFLKFVKHAFAFRRKFLLKNLKGVVDKSTMAQLPEIFAELKLKPTVRAEELQPQLFVQLYEKVHERH